MALFPSFHFPLSFQYYTEIGFAIPFVTTRAAANSESTLSRCELCWYDYKEGYYSVFDTRLLFPNAARALGFIDYDFKNNGDIQAPDSVGWLGIFYEENPDDEIQNVFCCVPLAKLLRDKQKHEEEIET